MANDYTGNPIYLDVFSAAIDIRVSLGFALGTPLRINSIEWVGPAATTDTAVITDKASGRVIFKETCSLAKQGVIKYYFGMSVDNLYIGSGGVTSGSILINLA